MFQKMQNGFWKMPFRLCNQQIFGTLSKTHDEMQHPKGGTSQNKQIIAAYC